MLIVINDDTTTFPVRAGIKQFAPLNVTAPPATLAVIKPPGTLRRYIMSPPPPLPVLNTVTMSLPAPKSTVRTTTPLSPTTSKVIYGCRAGTEPQPRC